MPEPPRVLPFRTAEEAERGLGDVVAHLRDGGLLAYPTETVYGFGCLLRAQPLAQLAGMKRRAPERPFLLLIARLEHIAGLSWSTAAQRLAAAFWPGPLTLALPASAGAFPDEVVGPAGTVAVRATSHPRVRRLLEAVAEPITSTSANPPGRAPATSADAAADALRTLGGERVLVLDGGVLPTSPPSTLVSCAAERPRLLREGAVRLDALRKVVPEIDA